MTLVTSVGHGERRFYGRGPQLAVPMWDALAEAAPHQFERLLSEVESSVVGLVRRVAGLAVVSLDSGGPSVEEVRRDAVAIVAGAVFAALTAVRSEEEVAEAFARGLARVGAGS